MDMSKIDKLAKTVIDSGALRKAAAPRIVASATAPDAVTAPTRWDMGAEGRANQDGLRTEPATDIDPETGRETPNPNGVRRRRRDDWVQRYVAAGHLSHTQAAHASTLRLAAEGMCERDPLARIGDIRGTGGDPHSARIDARRFFWGLWKRIPQDCRPVVERVVVDDMPIRGGNSAQRSRYMERLRRGLDAMA